jgi:nucleotide-binding universal stress UspA family protein
MNEFKRILVPLDGSHLAEKALPLATALARQFDSQLILIRAIDFLHPSVLSPHLTTTTAEIMIEAYKQAHQEAYDYLHTWQRKLDQQGLKVEILLWETSPAEGILDTASAQAVDCIVMGTHGRGGLARWTLGSVADKVARHAPCPVLLVRQNDKI